MHSSFDWLAYLELADELAQRSADEAALRSAVSRAYYALYGAVNVILSSEIDVKGFSDSHRQLWTHLSENPLGRPDGRSRRVIAIKGQRLKQMRKLADYDDRIDALACLLTDALSEAHDMRELLAKLE